MLNLSLASHWETLMRTLNLADGGSIVNCDVCGNEIRDGELRIVEVNLTRCEFCFEKKLTPDNCMECETCGTLTKEIDFDIGVCDICRKQ